MYKPKFVQQLMLSSATELWALRIDRQTASLPSQLTQDTVFIQKQAGCLVMTSQRSDPVSLWESRFRIV
jgi:hypothetical protein